VPDEIDVSGLSPRPNPAHVDLVAGSGRASFSAGAAHAPSRSPVCWRWSRCCACGSLPRWSRRRGKPVSATTFTLNIFSAGGTVCLVSGLVTAAIYRLHPRRPVRAFVDVVQFRWTILTVVLVLALAYVMNLSGQTVTLGLAPAATGGFFAFLSPVVGRLGVAVTGSDTSANSLFGLLQTTAAARTGISPIPLSAAKMISPQNVAIGAAVVGMTGRESELFRKVVGRSLVLLVGMSLLVFLQSTPVLGWMVVAP
jgi:lactate permease